MTVKFLNTIWNELEKLERILKDIKNEALKLPDTEESRNIINEAYTALEIVESDIPELETSRIK